MPIKTLLSALISTSILLQPASALAQGYNLPNLGAAGGASISQLEERHLGEEIMAEVRSDPTYLDDAETSEYLNRLGYKLVSAGPSSPYNFQFFAMRDPTLNAFALPGGFIAVHTGLLTAAKSESELASVMAHEVGHVQQRHIARMLENQRGNLPMTIGSILLAILAARAGSGDGAVAAVMGTQAALAQNYLSFSRAAENEADRVGFNSLVKAGFDPKGMEKFFERLDLNNRAYEGSRAAPAYLRTHPLTLDRMSEAQTRSRLAKPSNYKDSLDFWLIRARARILQTNRFQAWADAAKLFQDEAKGAKGHELTAAYYGLAVAEQRMKHPAKALEWAEKARKSTSVNSAILNKLYSELLFDSGKANRAQALQVAKQTQAQNPLSIMAATNYANLMIRDGKFQEALNFLRRQHALSKLNATYWRLMGRAYEALGKKSQSHQAAAEMYVLRGSKTAAVQQLSIAQRANDGDFYTMSEIDARLRQLRKEVELDKKYE